jgi:hypothetical protein
MTDEDLFVIAVEGEDGAAKDLESRVVKEEDCLGGGQGDLANVCRHVWGGVGSGPGDVVIDEEVGVTNAACGRLLLGLSEAAEDQGTNLGWVGMLGRLECTSDLEK